jgi:uncharacterized protein (TIGR02611 family)
MIRELNHWWNGVQHRLQCIQPPHARRVVILVLGGIVLLLGMVLIVLPGPGSLVIPAGLAILALEFQWARQCLNNVKRVGCYVARKTAPLTMQRTGVPPPPLREVV